MYFRFLKEEVGHCLNTKGPDVRPCETHLTVCAVLNADKLVFNGPRTGLKSMPKPCVTLLSPVCVKANWFQEEAETQRKYLDKAVHYFSFQNGLIHILCTQHMLLHFISLED